MVWAVCSGRPAVEAIGIPFATTPSPYLFLFRTPHSQPRPSLPIVVLFHIWACECVRVQVRALNVLETSSSVFPPLCALAVLDGRLATAAPRCHVTAAPLRNLAWSASCRIFFPWPQSKRKESGVRRPPLPHSRVPHRAVFSGTAFDKCL